jgi:hypothetical protein
VPRRKASPKALPPDWIERTEARIHGRIVEPGTELSIRGERGRFRFLKHVERPERGIEWLDVWGGPRKCEQWRSFHPSQVRRVHRINTTPKGLLDARKAAAATKENA